MDLRDRVLAAVDRGTTSREEIVRSLSVSQPTIRRYLRLRRETGSVAPKPLPKRLRRTSRRDRCRAASRDVGAARGEPGGDAREASRDVGARARRASTACGFRWLR